MADTNLNSTNGSKAKAAPKKAKRARGDATPGDVWVVVENEGGIAGRVSWELLGKAAGLAADLGSRVAVIILGEDDERLAQEAFSFGAQVAYVASHPTLTPFTADPHCRALSALARKYKPEAILLGATTRGRDLASAVATDLKTGLTADCT
ncbi:MAG: electron transfer flavoprotein subunit alpha, partial [Thermoleophilia bacterium]